MVRELIYNQIPIDFEFLKKKTFDNFIIGANEKLFYDQLMLEIAINNINLWTKVFRQNSYL